MAYNPLNPNGQAAMAASQPVVIASNQTPVSVAGTLNITGNPSISGTVNIGIIPGSVVAFVSGTVPVNTAGSVVTFQGTSPWAVGTGATSVITLVQGSIAVAVTPVANQSVSGAVSVSNFPTNQSVSGDVRIAGSVATVIIGGSISATFTPPANQSVSGTIQVDVRSSVAVAIISGSIAATFTPPANQSVSGTVDVTFPTTQNVSGSVVGFQGTSPWVMQSIVGTYAEDAAHTTADKGLFILGIRNDAVASLVSADLEYVGGTHDAYGRTVIKPFAPEEGTIISYNGSVVSGSVTLIQASAIGKRNYITDFWIANTGAATALLTFQGGDTSVVGYAIVPTGGGISSPGIAIPLKATASQDLAFKVSPSPSIIYLTVKGYQAP